MVVYRKETNDLDTITINTAAQSLEDATDEGEKTSNASSTLVPLAILTCRPNSHPFQERRLALDQPVKVGRSVVRCRPATNNAIFECKVLSRNHALLWYENGKFYLQDTKSSNGTFINNQRLSKGSEESPAREVCSGDIVQFGVDVVENSRKVVHGCVVATLRLYLPDGKEAKASPTTTVVTPTPDVSISSQELYQLSQYLQEALHREQVLESKLGTLQKVVSNTQDESNIGWKALIEEDRLLSRIETLESQLQTCGKNATEEKLKDDVMKLQDDKDKYQNAAKDSLKKVLEDKLDAIQKVQDLENSLSNAENECSYLRELNKTAEQEMHDLLEKNSEIENDISDLNKKLQDSEDKYQDLISQTADDKIDNDTKMEEMRKMEQQLSAKIESLEAENDFSREQLESIKTRFESYKENQRLDDKIEKNGLLSPTKDALDSTGKEGTEKEVLIQELFSEVNRLDRELRRVSEENNKNESSSTIKYTDNEEHHTNGDAKMSDYVNHLQAEIQQLKKLLSETRENKKSVDSEVVQLKNQLDEGQTNLKKAHDELLLVQRELSETKQYLEEKNVLVQKLEANIDITTEKKDVSDKQDGSSESLTSEKLIEELQRTQQQLKDSQQESQQLKKNISELTEEFQKKFAGSKSAEDYESLRTECALHKARVQSLESETRKYKNVSTRLEADNELLNERCTKLETAKVALESRSDEYWKEQISLEKSEVQRLNDQLSGALDEIVLVKERYSDCNDEMARLKKDRDVMHEQLQVVSLKSHLSYAFCIVPVVIILIAALMTMFPSLAFFTATSDQT